MSPLSGSWNSYENVRGVCEKIPVNCQAPRSSYFQQMVLFINVLMLVGLRRTGRVSTVIVSCNRWKKWNDLCRVISAIAQGSSNWPQTRMSKRPLIYFPYLRRSGSLNVCIHDVTNSPNFFLLFVAYCLLSISYYALLHIMCGYQCDKAANKNDTCEVIWYDFTGLNCPVK